MIKVIIDYLASILSRSPNVNFLTDVAAFGSAILAFLIPLSTEMISKLSERYKSEAIARTYIKEWINKLFPFLLVSNILLAVILRFFSLENSNSQVWKIFSWALLILFILTTFLTLYFFSLLRKYLSDIKFVIEKISHKIDDALKDKAQKDFISSVEGLGDILVYETSLKNKNEEVVKGLSELSKVIEKLFEIKKKDPDEFEKFILADEFFEIYKKDKTEAQARLVFVPEHYLTVFLSPINQALRIHQVAMENNNDKISRSSAQALKEMLSYLTEEKTNELFVEQVLKNLSQISYSSIKNNDASMYLATIQWYPEIVFDKWIEDGKDFDLSYLKTFDKYYFSNLKYVVSNGQTDLFKAFVSTLTEGIHAPSRPHTKIWDYGHILLRADLQKYQEIEKKYKIEKQIKELDNSVASIDSLDKLDKWIEKFENLKKILYKFLDQKQKREAKSQEDKIMKKIRDYYKFNNLLEIVFGIAAYCVFKSKDDLSSLDNIKYLWDYKQPPDSDATWAGHNVVFEKPEEVINFYFKKGLWERKFDFWEGHHGSEVYYKKYFILLLGKTLSAAASSIEPLTQLENISLPMFDENRLSSIVNSVDELINISKGIASEEIMMNKLGFDLMFTNKLFEKIVVDVLTNLKVKAQERIDDLLIQGAISQKKVVTFKDDVIKEFNKEVVLRSLLTHYKLIDKKISEVKDDGSFGINTVYPKEAFFDSWHVHYSIVGQSFGRDLARGEDNFLFPVITSSATRISEDVFEDKLLEIGDIKGTFVLASNEAVYTYLEQKESFVPVWSEKEKKTTVNELTGWLKTPKGRVPVIRVLDDSKQLVICNKQKLGKLVQYKPNIEGPDSNIKDILYIDVQSYSENEELLNKMLKKPPKWLKEIGNKEKQKKELLEKVVIRIFERVEFEKADNYEVYKLELKEEKI